jgi:CRISPR/Cas system-associated exonuclease Cas4 (RecB family)
MLETRTLDFENIIIHSLNEGSLPAGKKQNTFIPFEIKKIFGLPTYNDKDAIFSYHFYRLLSRAKNIYLLYNDDADSFKSAEKSRFIEQLKFEIPAYNPNIEFETIHLSPVFNDQIEYNGLVQIEKEPWIIDLIKQKLSKGISPSSLNLYRTCKLKFFLSEIVKIKEEEELDEELDAALFGNIVHEVLEKCFEKFLNLKLDEHLLNEIFKEKENYLKEAFGNNFGNKNEIKGKNKILYKVILRLISNYQMQLLNQLKKENISISSLEESIECILNIDDIHIKLYGKADRIELYNHNYRIIDYKTGKADVKELMFNNKSDLLDEKKNKGFQLFYYAYILFKKNKEAISAGIISFKDLKSGVKELSFNKKQVLNEVDFNEFESYLKELFQEILNPEVPFTKTSEVKNCGYCNFINLCNRG